ncbi:protein-disulfide reductase DsbD domain-containing protein [Jannaschia sp. 2305UL9-9]|uniref:protein-disulfide reductase DsbD domain-containing protein n=1 Tax=Jannaschia sp. 2305UL9-9 TaxID=3121638 RepID=UPI003527F83F
MLIMFFRILWRAVAFCLLIAGLTFATGQLALAQSPSQVNEVISVEVVPGGVDEDGRHIAGLRFDLRAGWKTYWRSAGSAGIAPRFDWSASDNIETVTPVWPRPAVFHQAGQRAIGYDQDFVLPLVIVPQVEGQPIRLSGTLDLGVCADICLPARLSVAADLTDDAPPDPSVRTALADQPIHLDLNARCALRPTEDGAVLTGVLDVPPLKGPEIVVFEVPDARLWVTDASVLRRGEQLVAQSRLMIGGGQQVDINRDQIRITVIGRTTAIETTGCKARQSAAEYR